MNQDHQTLRILLEELVEEDFPPAFHQRIREALTIAQGFCALPEPDPRVVSLDEHRIRADKEFEDETVAYLEVLWGRKTFAFSAAIRNLEQMRRGVDDKALRQPETYHEAMHLVLHVRALANDLARHFEMENMVRPEDDLREPEVRPPGK